MTPGKLWLQPLARRTAPAAASTLLHYFKDTGTEPQEFDCIYTGDLGQVGSQLLRELLLSLQAYFRRRTLPAGMLPLLHIT